MQSALEEGSWGKLDSLYMVKNWKSLLWGTVKTWQVNIIFFPERESWKKVPGSKTDGPNHNGVTLLAVFGERTVTPRLGAGRG